MIDGTFPYDADFERSFLISKLEIHQFFLSLALEDYLENLGQLLSLVNFQVLLVNTADESAAKQNLSAIRESIVICIRELRNARNALMAMGNQLIESGFFRNLETLIKKLASNSTITMRTVQNEANAVLPRKTTIGFALLLKIMQQLARAETLISSASIDCQSGYLDLQIELRHDDRLEDIKEDWQKNTTMKQQIVHAGATIRFTDINRKIQTLHFSILLI